MLDAEQSRRVDDLVAGAAVALHESMINLVKEITATEMARRFGKVWDAAELHAAQMRVYTSIEAEVAHEMSARLSVRLMNPRASA